LKILYATRLFSGLEKSFEHKVWKPTGVPTIYKVIEEFDSNHNVKFIFSVKDSGTGYKSLWKKKNDANFYIKGLKNKITVLAGTNYFFLWLPRKFSMLMRELRQTIIILIQVLKYQPQIIYVDHANTLVGAILSRFSKRLVIYRIMGVYPSMRNSIISSGLINKIFKWAYQSPFSLLICTQDGSGVEPWINQAIDKKVETHILLNGVDEINIEIDKLDSKLNFLPNDKEIILYVGKLEKYKGCYDFVNSIIFLLNNGKTNIHALIIGTGNEVDKLKQLISKNDYQSCFTFIEHLSHDQIISAHRMSDVYVSMNQLGNLSNSNLEAIQSNSCMVIPNPQVNDGIDIVTHDLLGNSVISCPINQPEILSEELKKLIDSKNKRDALSKLIKIQKKSFMWSWDERIEFEIKLLETLVASNK
jgi:glycosyltransferase involved in cell wall biosynthesis